MIESEASTFPAAWSCAASSDIRCPAWRMQPEATGFMPAHSLDMGIAELLKAFTMIRNSVFGNV